MCSISRNYRFGVRVGVIFCAAAILVGSTLVAFAQSSDEERVRQAKIDTFIQIAREQVKRGLYPQAQAELDKTATTEYAAFVSDPQRKEIASLLEAIQAAEKERQRVVQTLMESDALAAQGNYTQAAALVRQIQSSPYISEQEKKIVAASLKDYDEKNKLRQGQMQAVYDEAVRQYKAGQLDAARAGFSEVALSGVSVRGDQPAGDYLLAIDLQRSAASQGQPVQAAEQPMPQAVAQTLVVDQAPLAQSVAVVAAADSQADAGAESAYLQVIRRERAVRIDYTTAIVNDALSRAQALRQEARFEEGRQVLRRAISTVERNKLLLGDALFADYMAKLNNEDQALNEQQRTWQAEQDQKRQLEATQITESIRSTIETQRAKAIEDYMDRAYAFQAEQRYEESLGQLEQLLAIDPLNQRALIMRKSLEHWTRYVEQRRIQEETDREELELLLEANRRSVPFSKEINYPRNWKEIAARREKALQEPLSPADILVNKQLEQTIDLTMLTQETTLEEAINLLRNSVEPPLAIVVQWGDLTQNAFIERDTPVNISGEGLVAIVLRTALSRILQAVSSAAMAELGYVVEDGIITIATRDSLPTSFKNEVYDVSDLLNPPANYDEDNQQTQGGMGGQGGGMGGGMSGGMGGGMGGGMMGGMGGGMGGGMMGGGMGGGMSGGMGGGMGGGMMGGVGNWRSMYRAYQLIYTIQQTIDPDTWYEEGGDGRIDQYGESKLIIWQTPEVHKQIKAFLDMLRADLGQQVAIEARFLLVDENYLEDIGFDIQLLRFQAGGHFGDDGFVSITQDSADHVIPRADSTSVPGSLGGNSIPPAMQIASSFQNLDDLQVQFLIRATQMHRNSRQLTAPKAVVMNGESATMSVNTTRRIVSNSSLVSESVGVGDVPLLSTYWERELDDVDTGVQMSITPTITADKKYVILRISTYLLDLINSTDITVTAIAGGELLTDTFTLPTTRSSSIRTRVSVPDRGTVLLGGLTLTGEVERESGVPILSKIPLLNRLFSNRSEVKDKQILLILVKPTIMLQEETEQDAISAMSAK